MLSGVTEEQARAELATREVLPATAAQRCWLHTVRSALGGLPNSVHVGARRALNEIIGAEGRWPAVNGPHLVALVRAGASVARGKLVERAEPDQQQEAAA